MSNLIKDDPVALAAVKVLMDKGYTREEVEREMLKPLCDECGEWHEPREPCPECGGGSCPGDDSGHVYGCSDYAYCPQELDGI